MDQICPNCEIGLLRPTRAALMRIVGGTLLQAPHTPAWKCDVCGITYFDPNRVRTLDILAGEAGPPPNRHTEPPAAPRPESADADDSRPRPK